MNEGFELGTPALVCRWRLAGARLPLENRHLRALAARRTNGEPVTTELVAWAKQHLEWNLHDGAAAHPDGVLLLVVDQEGRAAMSVGPYEELADTSMGALQARAEAAATEARATGVAPETLWCVRDGGLRWDPGVGCAPSGAASLVEQLAETLGMRVDQEPVASAASCDELFLVSDEHGVVPAADAAGPVGARLREGWLTLLERNASQRR